MPLSIVHPRKQGHSGPSLFISVARPPAWSECIFLSALRIARLGQGQAGRRTGWGGCLQPLRKSPKGSAFPDVGSVHPLPETQPRHQGQPPVPHHPVSPIPTLCQQHVVQRLQLLIGRWTLPFVPGDWLGPRQSFPPICSPAMVQPAAA